MAVALRENRPIRGAEALAERPDGARMPFLPYPTPLRDASGALVGAVNMLVDISERKQAEDQQKALLAELNHRVKNTLATVLSMARQTLRASPDPAAFAADFEGRVLALSDAHDLLTRDGWTGTRLAEILEREFAAHAGKGGIRFKLDGGEVRLQPRVSLALSMVTHELAANAAKHGALSSAEGRVDVRWRIRPASATVDARLELDWIECDGPVVRSPARRGFGVRLVERTIDKDLAGKAEFDFAPSGLRCHIEVPVAQLARG